ncbi:LLM class F420-dependent oxidoreductase [Nocardia terpenica]|uniref:LLM class F420-dependent oxidoreductase n=1 Tax=Nocardia terpenica TaxID=455432 RepID=UPI001893DA26|nr:LLM class F420-dependent oxidoreductase [Nocardia terpenica]MBF6061217.1 LLM class F420-dependent oxidoreductase [Nocardia terpenica]MBF6105554.1 LLM class F420-dependent oxidoreductase [Nocardia terpenica]MBF6112976.1 LLM class F420-dependent oxidoreductase [Nocardia terpenica]MBF6119106.1 LLM class F420-dependent oxidoreductase [Nocardia terpenica]MBF6152754.1 LLM class F420-dependent oxidoreductase [Nocardia terpenica]
MRFGIFVPQGWRCDLVGIDPVQQWGVMLDLARRADRNADWESLWVYDHFHTVPAPTEEATHEAWTLMSAFAASTSRIRLGQMCTAMGYRNPVYLAKVAATVDHVSGGRVEMGIGGGWYEHEWLAYGYGFPSAGERLARLDEGVQIFRQAWTAGTVTLAGQHYQIDGALVRPLPVQEGGIPVWVAGGGEKKTLRIAARYAQYTNFTGDPEGFTRKSEILRAHCAEVGTDFDAIVRSSNFNTVVGATEAEVRDRLAALVARLAPALGADKAESWVTELFRSSPAVGTPEQIVENLSKVRDLGLGYAIHYFPESAYDVSGIELFEREVIPALR